MSITAATGQCLSTVSTQQSACRSYSASSLHAPVHSPHTSASHN